MNLESERLRLVLITRELCEAVVRGDWPAAEGGSRKARRKPSSLVSDTATAMLGHVRDNGTLAWTGWFVFDRSWPEPHGVVVLMDRVCPGGVAEIGWMVEPLSEGSGYASEAARAVVEWAIREGDLSKVTAHISVDNRASAEVARRVGFVCTGRVPNDEGQMVDRWEFTESLVTPP
jgi:RimJ/RimL family protein N-acetyltransferase